MVDKNFLLINYELEIENQKAIYVSDSKLILPARSKKQDNMPVALKFSRVDDELVDSYIANFLMISKLKYHPSILTHYNIHKLDRSVINFDILEVLELVRTIKLNDPLKIGISPLHLKQMVLKLLEGFYFLHYNKVLHKDVKPDNILIFEDKGGYNFKIIDFDFMGCAANQRLITTPEFLAPEVNTYSDYDVKAEIWSIGLVLFLIFGGKMPFQTRKNNLSIEEVKKEVLNSNFDFSKVPAPLRIPISLCLKKERQERIGNLGLLIFIMDPFYFLRYWFRLVFKRSP
ncbi:protein kinase [Algoriphagus sp. Y33]|uniref:protein kinase domain-containing protein n=1 Tax=Algoriphagus sp. Y33 TaxID=2772483 RepID=UPI0017804626|nr:protein kinase [Algoriphagus sp. Y33]